MKNIKTYEHFVNEEINLKKTLATGALAAGMAFSNPSHSQNVNKLDSIEVSSDINIESGKIYKGYSEDSVEISLGKPCSISFFRLLDGQLKSLKGWENISNLDESNFKIWEEAYLLATHQVWYYNYYIPSKDTTLSEDQIKSMPYMVETKNSFKVFFKSQYSYGAFHDRVFLVDNASCELNKIGKEPYIIKDNKTLSLSTISDDKVFQFVEEEPEPVGGLSSLNDYINSEVKKYLNTKLKYRDESSVFSYDNWDAQVMGVPTRVSDLISGRVLINFIVEKDGSISNIKVSSNIENFSEKRIKNIENEALRIINSYTNKWKPGKQNGKEVRTSYNLVISFN